MTEQTLFSIRPNADRSLVAVLLAWLFCWGVAELVAAPGQPFWVSWIPVLPFALIISYYGYFKTFLQGAGEVIIGREGFSISRGHAGTDYYEWDTVDEFFVGTLGWSLAHQGVPVPLFRLKDSKQEHGLPANTALNPNEFVRLMSYLMASARIGWPKLPGSLEDALAGARIPAHLGGKKR